MDKLDDLFAMQTALNDRIFAKRGLTGRDGTVLTMAGLIAHAASEEPKDANSDTCVWLRRYLEALDDESRELGEELPWKWWSKDPLDMRKIRVEIVDQLHFWISLAMTAGLDAAEVHRLYRLKNEINLGRQESGYSASTKIGLDDTSVA